MDNPINLVSKHILVTGASKGIGRATCIYLSKLGANVSLVSRNPEKLSETLSLMEGKGHKIHSFDLRDISNIENFIDDLVDDMGKLDGFVHCAGIGEMRPLQQTKFNFLHEVMLINFYAFIELARVIAKRKNCSSNSSFVAVSSVASHKGAKSVIAYCASKGAIDSAVRALAKELSGKGIRVNSVVPGFITTDLYYNYINVVGESEFNKDFLSNQYMGIGDATDVAHAIAFLLCDSAKFITGTGLVVDGGYLS